MESKLSLLTLNIGNPSLERAKKQCEWLTKRPEDVFVLTETKNSQPELFMTPLPALKSAQIDASLVSTV